MLKLRINCSSSKGNSYEIIADKNSIMLDCGKEVEIDNNRLKGIIASHQHL